MKNTLEGIRTRLHDTEDWVGEVAGRAVEIAVSGVAGRAVEITATEERTAKKKKKKNEKKKQETSGRTSASLIFTL